MILEFERRGALSLGAENVTARYGCARTITAASPSTEVSSAPSALRSVLELKRNLGGMIMRAQIGAEFTPGAGDTRYEVCIMGSPFDSGTLATCDSALGAPLIPGLPADFADAALNGLAYDPSGLPLPGGLLHVDRAGHDLMGSSEAAFQQAATLLRCAFSATISGADVQKSLSDMFARLAA
jgi:hypothetical protein